MESGNGDEPSLRSAGAVLNGHYPEVQRRKAIPGLTCGAELDALLTPVEATRQRDFARAICHTKLTAKVTEWEGEEREGEVVCGWEKLCTQKTD